MALRAGAGQEERGGHARGGDTSPASPSQGPPSSTPVTPGAWGALPPAASAARGAQHPSLGKPYRAGRLQWIVNEADNNYVYACHLIHLFEAVSASVQCLPPAPAPARSHSPAPRRGGFPWVRSRSAGQKGSYIPQAFLQALPNPGLADKRKLFK